MNQNDHRRLAFDLGVNNKGMHGTVVVLQGDVFVMTRRGLESSFSPVLRLNGYSGNAKQQQANEERE